MKTRVLYSAAGVEIVTQPFLVGPELERLALECSKDFARALPADLPADAVSLEILNGGRYYFVSRAVEEAIPGRKCPVSTLRAKRRQQPDGAWRVDVWDAGGVSAADCSALLIGDTVATGTTLMGTIKHLLDERRAQNKPLPDIHIFTIAGSSAVCNVPGIKAIDELLAGQGKALHLYFANAQFNLADNGTDLGFEGAVYDALAEREIHARLGAFAPCMRCCIWDWGDRFREVDAHLAEIDHFYGSECNGAPEWLLRGIRERRAARAVNAMQQSAPPAVRFALVVAAATLLLPFLRR